MCMCIDMTHLLFNTNKFYPYNRIFSGRRYKEQYYKGNRFNPWHFLGCISCSSIHISGYKFFFVIIELSCKLQRRNNVFQRTRMLALGTPLEKQHQRMIYCYFAQKTLFVYFPQVMPFRYMQWLQSKILASNFWSLLKIKWTSTKFQNFCLSEKQS